MFFLSPEVASRSAAVKPAPVISKEETNIAESNTRRHVIRSNPGHEKGSVYAAADVMAADKGRTQLHVRQIDDLSTMFGLTGCVNDSLTEVLSGSLEIDTTTPNQEPVHCLDGFRQ